MSGQAAGLVAFEAVEALFGEELGEAVRDLRAFWFFGGEEDEQVGIAAAEPGDEAAFAEDDLGIGGAGKDARCGFGVFGFRREIGPL